MSAFHSYDGIGLKKVWGFMNAWAPSASTPACRSRGPISPNRTFSGSRSAHFCQAHDMSESFADALMTDVETIRSCGGSIRSVAHTDSCGSSNGRRHTTSVSTHHPPFSRRSLYRNTFENAAGLPFANPALYPKIRLLGRISLPSLTVT